jgi:hypothetical protein
MTRPAPGGSTRASRWVIGFASLAPRKSSSALHATLFATSQHVFSASPSFRSSHQIIAPKSVVGSRQTAVAPSPVPLTTDSRKSSRSEGWSIQEYSRVETELMGSDMPTHRTQCRPVAETAESLDDGKYGRTHGLFDSHGKQRDVPARTAGQRRPRLTTPRAAPCCRPPWHWRRRRSPAW